jgi:transposase
MFDYFSKICPEISIFMDPLNPELNPICHLLALLGAHHIFHVSVLRVKNLTSTMGTLHEDQYIFFIISHSVLLRMRTVSDKSCRENQNIFYGQ